MNHLNEQLGKHKQAQNGRHHRASVLSSKVCKMLHEQPIQ